MASPGAQLLHPLGALAIAFRRAAARRLLDGFENRAAVADQSERDIAVLADVAVVEIDLHDGRIGAQPPAVAQTKIERTTDDDNHVGLVESQAARAVKAMGIAGREDAAAATRSCNRAC